MPKPDLPFPGARSISHFGWSAVLAVCLVVPACGDSSSGPEARASGTELDFSGTWNPAFNFGGPFGHDGNPVVTPHFKVFSAFASTSAREYTAAVAEEALREVLDSLAITPAAFDFVPTNPDKKIHIMAIGAQDFRNNGGFAYRDGMVVISTEAPNYRRFGYDETVYKRLIKHEGTHVVEFLLIGDPRYQQASDVWWREGFAHYMSRPRPSMITARARVEEWRDSHADLPGGGNPIAIHVWSDFPPSIISGGQTFSYYDLFELSVRYLLDPNGYGATSEQVIALYEAMGRGVPFPLAMSQTLGVDVAAFEAEYWDRILEYLDGL